MGNLYVPGGSGGTSAIKPYMAVNGLTKAVKKIYYGNEGSTVLVWPSLGSYLSHFKFNNDPNIRDFKVNLPRETYLNHFQITDYDVQNFDVILEEE